MNFQQFRLSAENNDSVKGKLCLEKIFSAYMLLGIIFKICFSVANNIGISNKYLFKRRKKEFTTISGRQMLYRKVATNQIYSSCLPYMYFF